MKKISRIFIAILLLTSIVNAEVSEAKKLCDTEIKKDKPNKSILNKQCSIAAKEFEDQKAYGLASWYYLLSGDYKYNIDKLEKKIDDDNDLVDIAHSYMLSNEMMKAKKFYLKVINDIPEGMNYRVERDYKLFMQIYPDKKVLLDKGLDAWRDLYINNINAGYVCKKELEKESPIQAVLEKFCVRKAREYESDKKLSDASEYYLFGKDIDSCLALKNYMFKASKDEYLHFTYCHIVENEFEKAKDTYKAHMQNNPLFELKKYLYKKLYKVYPEKVDLLDKGLKLLEDHTPEYTIRELCDNEIEKDKPNQEILQTNCLMLATYYKKEKYYINASKYYVMSGEYQKAIDLVPNEMAKSDKVSYIAHSYVLQGKLEDAKTLYKKYIVKGSDRDIQKDYKLLQKLYSQKVDILSEGLSLWNQIYDNYTLKNPRKLLNAFAKGTSQEKQKARKLSLKYANKMESEGRYDKAAIYYLFSGNPDLVLHMENKVHGINGYGAVAWAYMLKRDENETKKYFYKIFSKFTHSYILSVHKHIEGAYESEDKDKVLKGYELWKELYKQFDAFEDRNTMEGKSIYLDLIDKYSNGSNVFINDMKYDLGNKYYEDKQYRKSVDLLKDVIQDYEIKEYKLKELGQAYKNIIDNYKKLEESEQVMKYYKKYIEILVKESGEDHKDVLKTYFSFASFCMNFKLYQEALPYVQKLLYIEESRKKIDYEKLSKANFSMSLVYEKLGKNQKSKQYFDKGLDLHEKYTMSNPSYKKYIESSEFYLLLSQSEKATYYLRQAEAINDENLSVNVLKRSASVYTQLGNYGKALQLYNKILDQNQDRFGRYHSDSADAYEKIAVVYSSLGNYEKAIFYYIKALEIYRERFGENDRLVGKTYNKISGLYSAQKNYNKALKYSLLGLKVLEGISYASIEDRFYTYIVISIKYFDNNEQKNAQLYFKKALKVSGRLIKESDPNIYIGRYYEKNKEYTKALKSYKKALKIVKETFSNDIVSPENKFLAESYLNIGYVYENMMQYNNALEHYMQALKIYQKSIGLRAAMGIYHNISELYQKMQNYSESYNYAKKFFDFFMENRDENFQVLNPQQKELYLKDNVEKIPLLLETAYLYKEHNASKVQKAEVFQESINNWLNYKGSIFDSENAIATLYDNTKDTVLKEKIDDLIINKRYLAKLYQSLPKPKERIPWQNNIKQTEEKINTLTTEISEKAESFKEQQGLKSISYKGISSNLKEDELYIDYAKAGEYYYVFSLDNKEHIIFNQIDANSTREIARLVKTFREDVITILDDESITDEKLTQLTLASKEKLSRLYELTLSRPLSKELSTKQNLIISPDGALRLLPFEAMYDKDNGKYLIEEKEIRYIPSGKELVRLYRYGNKKVAKNNAQTSVIISNPNYDAKDITKVASKEREEEFLVTPNTNRAGIIKSLFKMRFTPLPGTKAEAASIKETLKYKKITEYKEEQANESNLLTIQQPNILHIATHGFFINDNTIPNPMLKSGIALSGANASAIKGKSNGIVTALKLSGLKLKGTDLVVLSACQTGVVDPDSTDSVSGLSKAFIQAGAKDIVMSLWSVDDQATKDLMSSFYQKMQKHPSYAKALQEAKLKMIEKDMHPFYWAPFIVNGL